MKRLIAVAAALSTVPVFAGAMSRPHNVTQTAPSHPVAAKTSASLPLAFEPNVGQADSAVRFLAHGSGSGVFLASTGVTLSIGGPQGSSGQRGFRASDPPTAPSAIGILGLTFVGANRAAQVIATDRLAGVSNYFIGNDPSAWRTGVPRYARVTYWNLYPGIDLTFYGNRQGRLEYDFTVAPGADPSLIRLAVRGQHDLTLDPSGDLALDLGTRTVVQRRPLIYQPTGLARQVIPGGYAVQGDRFGFSTGAFDPTRPLVIDPEVEYSTYLGGSGDDLGDVQPTVDNAGHVYICGNTDSPDFPVTPGAFQPSLKVGFDAFVTKMNSKGSGLVYSTYLGGRGTFDLGIACSVDRSQNLYLAGVTSSDDFPTTTGVVQPTFQGGDDSGLCFDPYSFQPVPCDGFVAKLSPDGTTLEYSTYVGGTGDESLQGVQVDRWGNAFVAGATTSTDFPVTKGAFQTRNAGGADAVVLKLDPTASSFLYSTYLGGEGDDGAGEPGLAVDGRGSAYVEGGTASRHFPTTRGAFQRRYAGNGDFFVTKLDPSGSRLVYSTYVGGSGPEIFLNGATVDSSGNAYLVGTTCSTDFPVTPGAFQTKNPGRGGCIQSITDDLLEGVVAKLNGTGSALVFSTYLGGKGWEELGGGQIDRSGHVYVDGFTSSIDYPVTRDAFQPTNHGGPDRFDGVITELTSDGSDVIFSTYWGGSGDDLTGGSALDSSGNLYVNGCSASSDFPTTKGAFQRTLAGGDGHGFGPCAGGMDAVVVKIGFDDEGGQAGVVRRGSPGEDQSRPAGTFASASLALARPIDRTGGSLLRRSPGSTSLSRMTSGVSIVIRQYWLSDDLLDLMQQLGIVPTG